MPPTTRALATSATASEKLENVRVPGRTSEVTLNAVSSPNAAARTNAAEPLTVEWPDGYSGCGGVPMSGKKSNHGTQVGPASAGVSPVRFALIGRQKTQRYLPSQQTIPASSIVTFSVANSRAFSVIATP